MPAKTEGQPNNKVNTARFEDWTDFVVRLDEKLDVYHTQVTESLRSQGERIGGLEATINTLKWVFGLVASGFAILMGFLRNS